MPALVCMLLSTPNCADDTQYLYAFKGFSFGIVLYLTRMAALTYTTFYFIVIIAAFIGAKALTYLHCFILFCCN